MALSAIFFFNDTATTEIYTLSLHDALPISLHLSIDPLQQFGDSQVLGVDSVDRREGDRKSTRLNSSHANISYAVFCLKKKTLWLPGQQLAQAQASPLPRTLKP